MSDEVPRVRGRVPIHAGEHAVFASGVAAKMVGQTTADGWIVVDAEQTAPDTIWLTLEGRPRNAQNPPPQP